jgi:hypothetical protein
MKQIIGLILGGLALAVLSGVGLRAADPTPPRSTGKVLLLENERTIIGQIEREGNQYRVRRQVGETWVPAASVLYLCDSLEEAYAFLRARANPRDADERLRLARWCHLHGLSKQALAEATAAAELRPQSAACQGLLQTLQRSSPAAKAPPSSPTATEPPRSEIASLDVLVDAETMSQFVKRVQPILMNTCASCHMSGRAGTFQLQRAFEDGMVNRRATQHNLNAVLGQMNRAKWAESPLLLKAISVHGPASQPPLKGRQAPAFRALEDWVRKAVANNPQLQEPSSPTSVLSTTADPKTAGDPGAAKMGKPAREPFAAPPPAASAPASPATPPAASAIVPRGPVDPFDPAVFNQQTKPAQKPKAPK